MYALVLFIGYKLELLDSDKGPRLMPCSERISVLAKILIIIHQIEPIFRHEHIVDESSLYMEEIG